jgi:regulator of replication initiation timing
MTMLLRLSAPRADLQQPSTELAEKLPEDIDRLESALATLKSLQETTAAMAFAKEQFTDSRIEAAHGELLRQQREVASLELQIADNSLEAANLQKDIDGSRKERTHLTSETSRLVDELKRAKQLAKDAASQSERVLKPARGRSTSKMESAIILRYDRVYRIYEQGSSPFRRSFNKEDLVVIDERGGKPIVSPRPYRGLPVDDSSDFANRLRSLLSEFPSRDYYFAIAVWDDSFDSFHLVRDALANAGYEYRLLVFDNEATLEFGPVDNPQVQ